MEAEKKSLKAQPFDLRACIEEVLDLVNLESRRKGLELGYRIKDDVPVYLLGDENLLSQVLANLVNNAVKFTEEGEITLSVCVRLPAGQPFDPHTPAKKLTELLFAIRDTGIGIPRDQIDTLFSPFRQSVSSTTRKFGGAGLGLSISKKIVQLMDGEIWAESSGIPGEGSTFYFTIKVQTTDAPAPPYPQKDGSLGISGVVGVGNNQLTRQSLECQQDQPLLMRKQTSNSVPEGSDFAKKSLRILIAEDDQVTRKMLSLTLDHLGYQHEAAANGVEAITALEEKTFDVVLMDLQMPEMHGLSATSYIRTALPKDQQPFIIALTADARVEVREEMVAVGVNEYLNKPIRHDALVQALDRAYEQRAGKNQAAQRLSPMPVLDQDNESVLDESVLADFINLMGEDASDVLSDLVASFVEDAPTLIQTLKNAAAEKNWQQVKWAAHALKGNCELLGGVDLAQMCKQLENRIDGGEVSDVLERIEHIEVEFKAVKSALLDIST